MSRSRRGVAALHRPQAAACRQFTVRVDGTTREQVGDAVNVKLPAVP